MAEVLEISGPALARWIRRAHGIRRDPGRRGRPEVIPETLRDRIRACYVAHYRQWGPRVLAHWCGREGLGEWSASTIGRAISDLRQRPEARAKPVRYEVTISGVMWSEDGTGFRERGRKKELLVIQDEHARLKLGHRLVAGPADEEAVYNYLAKAFSEHGPPLVLKHDGGSIFHGDRIRGLLAKYGVTDLTGPRSYPQYNGKQERSMRDIKSFERAMRRQGMRGRLRDRLDAAIGDLNDDRPRPMLGGRTARETYRQDHKELPDRRDFIEDVDRTERELRVKARSRRDLVAARRRAVELSLLRHGLIAEWGDVSRNSSTERRTN